MHSGRLSPQQAFEALDLLARHAHQAMFLLLVIEDCHVNLLITLVRSLPDPPKRLEPLSLLWRQILPLLQDRRPPLLLLLPGRCWHQDAVGTGVKTGGFLALRRLHLALRGRPVQFQLIVGGQSQNLLPVPFHQLAELFLAHHDQRCMLEVLPSTIKAAGIGSFPHA